MTYGDTPYKMAGIKKEDEYLSILNESFKSVNIILIKSSLEENKKQKVDYWGLIDGRRKYAFDLKTAINPAKKFNLTYKMNKTNENVFEVGEKNCISIFLLEHINSYALIWKKDIFQWFKKNNPKLNPGKRDNSNYFEFPTEEIMKLAFKIKQYK